MFKRSIEVLEISSFEGNKINIYIFRINILDWENNKIYEIYFLLKYSVKE